MAREEALKPQVAREVNFGEEFVPFENSTVTLENDGHVITEPQEYYLANYGDVTLELESDWFMDVGENWRGVNMVEGKLLVGTFRGDYVKFGVSVDGVDSHDFECELFIGDSKFTARSNGEHNDGAGDLAIFNDWFDEKGESASIILLDNQLDLLKYFRIKFNKLI